jgi:hypothetical protein
VVICDIFSVTVKQGIAETVYHGNPGRNHKFWNTYQIKDMQPIVAAGIVHFNGKFTIGKFISSLIH